MDQLAEAERPPCRQQSAPTDEPGQALRAARKLLSLSPDLKTSTMYTHRPRVSAVVPPESVGTPATTHATNYCQAFPGY